MLDFFRKLSKTWAFRLFFAALALSFINWGVGYRNDKTAGEYDVIITNKHKVSLQDLVDEMLREGVKLQETLGVRFSMENLIRIGLLDETIKKMTSRAVLISEAKARGVYASDDALKESILTNPQFKGADGSFSKDIFNDMLRRNNYSEQTYVQDLKYDMMQAQISSLFANDIPVPEQMAKLIYTHRYETRIIDIVSLDASKIIIAESPEAKELEAIYEDIKNQHMLPEYRNISVLKLGAIDVENNISISEEEINQRVKEQKNLLESAIEEQEEKRKVLQMQFSEELLAKAAVGQVKNGKDFITIAKEVAKQDKKTTDMGLITADELPDEISSKVFAAEEGETIGPIKSPLGWHVFKIAEITQGLDEASDEELKQRAERELKAEKTFRLIETKTEEIRDAIGGGKKLADIAEEMNLTLTKVEATDIDGKDKSGKKIDNLAEKVLESAFTTAEEGISDIIETPEGFAVVQVNSVTPTTPKIFETLKAEVEKEWLNTKRQEKAEEISDNIMKELQSGIKPENISYKDNQAVNISSDMEIDRFSHKENGTLTPETIGEAFAIAKGDFSTVVTQKGYNIIEVKSVTAADPDAAEKQVTDLKTSIKQPLSDNMVSQFTAAMGKKHNLSINYELIDKALRKDAQ